MTLIKFNIENKTKEQRKKEVLNKLRKIQSLVESDANYTEMVYHIITNASLQKKNMKVNLDHYGNYTVIDAKNKIVSGGMVNSNESNLTHVLVNKNKNIMNKNNNHPNKIQSHGNSKNQKTIMPKQQNKAKVREVGSSGNITSIASQSNTSSNTTKTSATVTTAGNTTIANTTIANTTAANTTAATPTTDLSKTSTPDKKTMNTENQQVESKNNVSAQDETEPKKPSFLNTLFGSSKDKTGISDAKTSDETGQTSDETGQTMTPETEATGQPETSEKKETGLFGITKFWGGKNNSKTMDNVSFPSYHTTVFNEGGEDIFMEHMKNMSNKKYLRSLTTQELKDIMRSNHMKVTHNGSYYNKEQMVNKVYQFYK
jgi:hypothetical protein